MTNSRKKGFTLLELLIVITILAILTLVVVLFINPVEILKKSRDVQRMSDLDITRSAINLYLQDNTSNNLGGSTYCVATATGSQSEASSGAKNVVKTSLVATTAPSGVTPGYVTFTSPSTTYATATTSADLALANGKGWIPGFDFTTVTSGAPISKLPVDPTNTATSGGTVGIDSLYYRYGCRSTNNTFELDATLESSAYGPASTSDNKASKDGGNAVMRYEVGTDLTILASTAPIL